MKEHQWMQLSRSAESYISKLSLMIHGRSLIQFSDYILIEGRSWYLRIVTSFDGPNWGSRSEIAMPVSLHVLMQNDSHILLLPVLVDDPGWVSKSVVADHSQRLRLDERQLSSSLLR